MGKFGAGALFLCLNTGRFLFNQRAGDEHEPGTWSSWGGMGDSWETPIECMIREVREEAGFVYKDEMFIPVDVFEEGNGFEFHNFIIFVDEEFEPTISSESSGFRWATIYDVPHPLHSGLYVFIENNKEHLRKLGGI